ncbi:hypothetical protein [Halalkalicoccus subterraneus]|uniref:hypothetical protein n=1 Tax=Halalkalicoccus subterraneus TaxID=2675002 RepID=UPI000EFCE22B|nr:hypothetical protein [Halalkalicoccus subterraneus]
MRSDLSEIRSSPLVTAVFLLALVVFVGAILFAPGGDSWGAPMGSPEWLLGAACATLAVALGVRSWMRGE